MYKYLESERLVIRPIEIGDASFIFSLVNSEGWLRNIGDRNIKNDQDAANYIHKILSNKKYYYNVFELKTENKAIGIITFLAREKFSFPDIGFAILPEFEKLGYTFEAANKYLQELVLYGSQNKIIGITLKNNIPSINLLSKLGLTFEKNYFEGDEELSLYGKLMH